MADEPTPEASVTQGLYTPPTGGPCARFICGANSPMIDAFEMHELSLDPRVRNDEGFELAVANQTPQIVQRGVSYELRVADGRISAWSAGKLALEGQALVDATIPVLHGRAQFSIAIRTVREMTFFVDPRAPIEAYTLEWRPVGQDVPAQNLCNNVQSLRDQIAVDPEGAQRELMGMDAAEAVVFEGDRVNAGAKEMAKPADDRWFNLGCAGHTLSKLRLTHNTVHSQAPALPRAWEQRQATLKMLVADYCGGGTAFTVAGQPLVWKGGAVDYVSSPRVFEARWTEAGAACLYQPRLMFPTPLGLKLFPDIRKAIDAECRPARCTNRDFADFDGADRISANP
ncbi:MAG: ADYC domain-containing protein [Kofleriaceae bacterium]